MSVKGDGGWPLLPGERRVRFVCGVIAGVLAGIGIADRLGASSLGKFFLIIVTAIAFGFAAAWIGDRFWTGVGQ
jgi:high-affinity Fe2+/Pb2+ permease